MRKEEKQLLIEDITEQLSSNPNFYLTDISNLNAEKTSNLRRLCFNRNIKLLVVKNALLRKAMERSRKDMSDLYVTLKGATSIMFSDSGNAPAKLIKEFRKTSDRPILKGAFIEEASYVGDTNSTSLSASSRRMNSSATLVALLQSPVKNVIGSLAVRRTQDSGILQTLSEKAE
jgi:large subunit ribosomal protein L10